MNDPITDRITEHAETMVAAGAADTHEEAVAAIYTALHAPLTPTEVACPDCHAQALQPCHFSGAYDTGAVHANRRDAARLRSVEHGTCSLCGNPMVRGQRAEGGPVTAWHHLPEHQGCPQLPDPSTRWNDYAAAINAGLAPGEPGVDAFRPADPWEGGEVSSAGSPTLCPECVAGKHVNCTVETLHPVTDLMVPCECEHTP